MGLALASGTILRGKYRLEQVLGRGGMGTVHLATHLVIGQRVAIKIVNPSPSEHDYVVARFLREARAAALLESEHVVRILDVDALDDGTPFMVMEYLHGSDLGAILRKGGRLPLNQAVGYVLEACEALAEAHAAGIVHRDLKPSNLFRAETARKEPIIKLLDFGISKLAAPGEDLSLTDTQAVIGSPLFMSPEQLLSSRDVDHRTDIWSIGVTLYQLAAGALPFEASSASALGAQIAARAPRTLSTVLPEVPRDLEAVVMRCLARAPEDRYSDVAALARALAAYAGDDAVLAVERAAERGARGRPPASSIDQKSAAAPLAAIEASHERWTQSRAAGEGESEGLATGSREKPTTASRQHRTLPSHPPAPAAIPSPPVTQPLSLTAPASPVALGNTPPPPAPNAIPTSSVSSVTSPPRRRSSRRGLVIMLFVIGAAVVCFAAVFFVMKRRHGKPVDTPSVVATTAAPTDTPTPSSSSSSTSASAASTAIPSTTPSARSSAPPRGPGIRTTKPGATWSKDPSELELK